LIVVNFVVTTSTISCLEGLVFKVIYCMWSETLNSIHSLILTLWVRISASRHYGPGAEGN